MNINLFIRGYQRSPNSGYTALSLRGWLAAAGLLSLSTAVCLQTAQAADIGSQSGTNITVNDGDRITGDTGDGSGNRYGVLNSYNNGAGTINLGNNVTVNVTDTDKYAKGVVIQGNNSVLNANGLSVDVNGKSAIGIDLSGKKAEANLGTGSSVKVEGTGNGMASGVVVSNASTLTADRLSIETKGNSGTGLSIADYGSKVNLGSGSTIKTNGTGSYGIRIDGLNGTASNGPAYFTATNLTIDAQGSSAYGMNIQRNSIVDLGTDSKIMTNGDNAHGIWSFGDIKADALTIIARGSNANALEVRGGTANIGAGSHMYSELGGGLVTNGSGTTINFTGTADNRNTIFSGGSYGASAQFSGAKINLANTDITIDRNGSLGLGLWALGGGVMTGDNISVTGAAGTRGVYAMTNSQIDLTGDLTINMATADQIAIATQHNDGYAASRINATGKMLINGGIQSRGGLVNVDMASGSQWTGNAYSDNVNGGLLNVTMDNSRWNVTDDSNLDNLTLNNTTVDLSHRLSDTGYSTLSIANLSGNGAFTLRTDIVGDGDGVNNAGDKLVVTGTSAGDYSLTVLNRGSLATTGNEILTVVETADGAASFTSTSEVELGGYLYDVRKNGNNWELYSSGAYVPPPVVPDPDPEPEPEPEKPKPPITTTADAGGNFLNVGYLINYAETQTLMQRMGDLRQNGGDNNAWLRGFGGKFNSFAGGKMSGFDMTYGGTQLGFDKRISPDTPLYIGTFAGLTQGSPDYRGGDGTVRSYHLGLYTTYMADNGFYVDGIAKVSRLKNKFSVSDSQNNNVSGDGSSTGVSLSAEAGRKFSLSRAGNGFYIEPQAQLTYSHQDSTGIHASNGLKIDLGSYDSTIGRAGTLIGYETTTGDSQINVYLKTGFVREFQGNTDYKLNGSREAHSFKGNWWNNGLGISANISKKHTLYAEADSSTGNRFDQYQINGGYRFSF
ncbi:autotransporter outer membrane beta-barrel domain-containing protein [Morganella morganii]|uniref:Autotransporter outer membrane beta-barrel domain-containing protein n=2 Tax=Bacteria TaxID=2 RepID=A0AAU6TTU4_UNCXX|nr:autotransporter outer membrane beta-barrel domain-containing protein [Morganella morganii]MCU6356039.1 autotransporter outer membrane beta-barrel domain-containing protein [Morganella morganii]MDW7794768.1 autotransporter outer membrane beta-barrel domain-containing protein [Morganella morganii]HDS3817680.1 autotransporter outer membrane beta-barrel domain-containing protein [Morganella morganii subsp. morganii]